MNQTEFVMYGVTIIIILLAITKGFDGTIKTKITFVMTGIIFMILAFLLFK